VIRNAHPQRPRGSYSWGDGIFTGESENTVAPTSCPWVSEDEECPKTLTKEAGRKEILKHVPNRRYLPNTLRTSIEKKDREECCSKKSRDRCSHGLSGREEERPWERGGNSIWRTLRRSLIKKSPLQFLGGLLQLKRGDLMTESLSLGFMAG